jgi:dihydrolipoamide dehydrogenase
MVDASCYIIATGSQPVSVLGGWSERLKPVERIFSDGLPESTVIVGGGAVGCEMAGALSLLGTKVWLVEIMPELIPGEDRDLGRFVRRGLKKLGVDVRVDTGIGGIEADGSKIAVRIEEDQIQCEMVLEATGRRPVTSGLGLADIGIELENGYVTVAPSMETSREGFFAIGDVTPGPQLAHVASKGGLVAADNILGGSSRLDLDAVPSCVFSIPPVASVGISSRDAAENVEQIRIPFGSNSAAYSRGKEDGFIKLVVDTDDATLRGAQVAGDEANLLIAELTLAVSRRMKAHELAEVIRAHPTLAEIVGEACEAFYGRSIHFHRPPAKSGKG